MYRRSLSVIASLFMITGINAMTKAYSDSLSVIVYYPCGSSSVSAIPGNILLLKGFINQLDSLCKSPLVTPVSLFVTSSTSPEGSSTQYWACCWYTESVPTCQHIHHVSHQRNSCCLYLCKYPYSITTQGMLAHIACKDTAKIYFSSSFLFDLTKKVLPLQPN